MSFIPVMFSGRPHLTSPKEKNKAQPSLSETLYSIGVFENVEQRYKDDVIVIKFGLVNEAPSFSHRRRKEDEAC
jgi:hypothetical protein